ncbi:MAG: hypothetical protein AMXMBFR64_60690 [Myxococcales bacterium]
MTNEALSSEPTLVRRPHTAYSGTPYFDEDLQAPQSAAHRIMVGETVPILAAVAAEAGLLFLSDEPIWYLHPETDEQKAYYGDCVLARPTDVTRITADDLLLVIEVVSTNDRRKENKDRWFQRMLNEFNGVPEFGLAYPDLDDPRALTWFRFSEGEYVAHDMGPGAKVSSEVVPGLDLLVLPRDQWSNGHKIDIYYRGQLRLRLAEVRRRAEQERARAEQERARAEQEKARAEQEKARADRLAQQLLALGVDPGT